MTTSSSSAETPDHRSPTAAWRFILATDLDGTFLGGSEDDRKALYGALERNRDRLGLVFVTGRDPEFIEGLCADGRVPWPDFVVGDVGTTIAEVVPAPGGKRVRPIPVLEQAIAELWNNAAPKVRARLNGHPGLQEQTEQAKPFRHRLSYHLDPAAYDGRAEDLVVELGLDALISDNRYFDVLPKGVSKGPSLIRLVRHLGLDRDRVLVAGDTLNDLSMFKVGLHGVAVGNSEAALIEGLGASDPRIHRAKAHGAGGILEAVAALNLFDFSLASC
ncbi:MAG: HAD family hydrolase [Rhodospirillales bacterium]